MQFKRFLKKYTAMRINNSPSSSLEPHSAVHSDFAESQFIRLPRIFLTKNLFVVSIYLQISVEIEVYNYTNCYIQPTVILHRHLANLKPGPCRYVLIGCLFRKITQLHKISDARFTRSAPTSYFMGADFVNHPFCICILKRISDSDHAPPLINQSVTSRRIILTN